MTLIGWSLTLNMAWAPVRGRLFGAVGLIWLSLVVFGVSIAVLLPRAGGIFGPEVAIGWQNRLLMVTYCVWLITAANRQRCMPHSRRGARGPVGAGVWQL